MDTVIYIIEIIGTIAFSISGAMVAIDRDLDVFGVLFMGLVVALGGGTIRDVLLGVTPPVMFSNYIFVCVAVLAALAVFVLAALFKRQYAMHELRVDHINAVFDSLGLAAFTVSGIQATIAAGYGDNALLCIVMGTTTAVGGGIIRDVCVRTVPMVFRKRIYAVASLLGGICYYVMYANNVGIVVNTFVSIGIIFAIRVLAIVFRLNLPKAGVHIHLDGD